VLACAGLLWLAQAVLADRASELINFTGIKPGDKVADFMPYGGYFTQLFCKLVGDAGHVYVIGVPPQSVPSASEAAGACHNVTTRNLKSRLVPAPELHDDSDPGYVYEYWSSSPAAENFTAPEPLDVIWTSGNYHDLRSKAFGSPDMSRVNTALFAALKPGGLLLIEDHRIAVGQVRQEVTQAGFEFVGKLHDGADKRTVLKFRKPPSQR
jgi:predicted methyltransferase